MELYYQGTSLSGIVNVTGCVHRDAASGRADSLEITFDHAAAWFRWGPQTDDVIRVYQDGYDTGSMYLNTILPEGDHYRMIASSLPSLAGARGWHTFQNTTLEAVLDRCAAECGMGYKLFGVDGGTHYTYLLRRNEGCAALLNRLAEWEGMFFKSYNGTLRAIGMALVQEQSAAKNLRIPAGQDGAQYIRQDNARHAFLTVRTPWAEATAKDSAATGQTAKIITSLPARNAVEAGRWARGLLTHHNRQAERMMIRCAFDPTLSALARVNVGGNTDANGAWIVEDAEHDLYSKQSRVKLLRTMDSIS